MILRSHRAAVAWEFRRRHRWGLIAVAGYLLALAIFKLATVMQGQAVTFDHEESFCSRDRRALGDGVLLFPGGVQLRFCRRPGRATIDLPCPSLHAAGDERRVGGMADALRRGSHGDPVAGNQVSRRVAVRPRCPVDLAGPVRRGDSRLDAGADVDAVCAAGAACDRHGASCWSRSMSWFLWRTSSKPPSP